MGSPGAGDHPPELPFEIHAFVEGVARGEITTGAFDVGVQQVEIDVAKRWKRAALRLDLQYDRYYGAPLTADGFVEQAWAEVDLAPSWQLKLGIGRFNAPYGWEMLDPVDKVLISHTTLFNYLDPFLLSGARISFTKGPVDGVLWVAQGYEITVDNNRDKTVGGRVGLRPHAAVYLGLSGAYGSESADNDDKRLQLDVDLTLTPHEQVLVGAEAVYRSEEGAAVDGGVGRVFGGLVSVTGFLPNRRAMFTGRWDVIADQGGGIWGAPATVHTVTVGPALTLGSHARILAEYRGWFADTAVLSTSPSPSGIQRVHDVPLATGDGPCGRHTPRWSRSSRGSDPSNALERLQVGHPQLGHAAAVVAEEHVRGARRLEDLQIPATAGEVFEQWDVRGGRRGAATLPGRPGEVLVDVAAARGSELLGATEQAELGANHRDAGVDGRARSEVERAVGDVALNGRLAQRGQRHAVERRARSQVDRPVRDVALDRRLAQRGQ
jgi:hypothetical protein